MHIYLQFFFSNFGYYTFLFLVIKSFVFFLYILLFFQALSLSFRFRLQNQFWRIFSCKFTKMQNWFLKKIYCNFYDDRIFSNAIQINAYISLHTFKKYLIFYELKNVFFVLNIDQPRLGVVQTERVGNILFQYLISNCACKISHS